jgi:hypothetical protein
MIKCIAGYCYWCGSTNLLTVVVIYKVCVQVMRAMAFCCSISIKLYVCAFSGIARMFVISKVTMALLLLLVL